MNGLGALLKRQQRILMWARDNGGISSRDGLSVTIRSIRNLGRLGWLAVRIERRGYKGLAWQWSATITAAGRHALLAMLAVRADD